MVGQSEVVQLLGCTHDARKNLESLLHAGALLKIGSSSRQADMAISWVRVAFQEAVYTSETRKKLLSPDFNGSVQVELSLKPLKSLASPNKREILVAAIYTLATEAGLQNPELSIVRRLGGVFGQDKVVVTFLNENDANAVKQFSESGPSPFL